MNKQGKRRLLSFIIGVVYGGGENVIFWVNGGKVQSNSVHVEITCKQCTCSFVCALP